MKTLKYISSLVAAIVFLAGLAGCEKGPNFKEYYFPAPVVENFSPQIGYSGEDIIITGKDFGTNINAVKVFFGEIRSDSIRSVEDNRIVVKAPANGVSAPIRVAVYAKENESTAPFTFLPSAAISKVSAEKGKAGDVVTIDGENFGTEAAKIKVIFSGVESEIIAVTNNRITFKIPDAKSGNLILVVDRQRLTGPYMLIGTEKLSGTIFGHSGSWGNNVATTIQAAFDGNIATFVDGLTAVGYMGYDLGKGKAARLTSVRFAPRTSHPQRMTGGEIRGANDPSLNDFKVLATISTQPPVNVYTELSISSEETFRYVYYYTANGNGNIAEIEFYGNVVDKPLPVGKMIFEFNMPGDNEGWKPQQGGTWTVTNGALNVTFTQATGNKRSDLALLVGNNGDPVTIHTGNYPIFAIKFNKPTQGNVVFDTNFGSFGNGNNKYASDYADKDVYYYDMSALGMGTAAPRPNEEITFTGTFQLKIADVPQANPATGYSVQWIRTFASKQELENFIK